MVVIASIDSLITVFIEVEGPKTSSLIRERSTVSAVEGTAEGMGHPSQGVQCVTAPQTFGNMNFNRSEGAGL
jgi:hypothetical protein